MKLFTTALGLFTCSAGFASATLIYNGGDMAADANWTIRESSPGVDTTPVDGLLDGTANNGPVLTTDGNAAWQLNDQNTGSAFDLPQLKHEFDPATASDMATKGFSLTFRFENLGTRGASGSAMTIRLDLPVQISVLLWSVWEAPPPTAPPKPMCYLGTPTAPPCLVASTAQVPVRLLSETARTTIIRVRTTARPCFWSTPAPAEIRVRPGTW